MQSTCSNIPNKDFVYLSDIDPSIIQSVRYYSNDNFVGKKIVGYNKPTIILTKQAAIKLKEVHKDVQNNGYTLVVYDGYRPQKSVDFLVAWGRDAKSVEKKDEYYPHIDKEKVFNVGYVATKSSHTRGSTIDLTLIEIGKTPYKITKITRNLTDGRTVSFLDDGTIDMGTSFDLFDEASHHNTTLVSSEALERRNYLRAKMLKHGFSEYNEEWWHYTLKEEPFPNQYFDFNIE